MARSTWWFGATALCIAAACTSDGGGDSEQPAEDRAPAVDTVIMETSQGQITMELYPDKAPETVRNFLLHVRSGFYDGLQFHRVEAGFVIQAGRYTEDMAERTSPTAPIANEAQNGLLNERGTVAMARSGGAHSAKSEFFINIKDNPGLDFKDETSTGFGYAVFGRVVEGMDVVDRIANTRTERRRQLLNLPVEPIVIHRTYVHQTEGG